MICQIDANNLVAMEISFKRMDVLALAFIMCKLKNPKPQTSFCWENFVKDGGCLDLHFHYVLVRVLR